MTPMRPNREVILVLSNLNMLLGALSAVVGSMVLLSCKEYKYINCGLLSGLILFGFGIFGHKKHDGTEQELKLIRYYSSCMIPILLIALVSGSIGIHCERSAKNAATMKDWNLPICTAITELVLPMCLQNETSRNITDTVRASFLKQRDTGITMHTFLISCTLIMLACNLCIYMVIPDIIKQEVYENNAGTAADQHYQFDNNELLENEILARKPALERHQRESSPQSKARLPEMV
ncbi:hypothetical protein M513_05166 [Trichuris suis]|uniref:Uncharacterized protein n=1 Tax=Trichuris suis TaxID=68888 RepID=A0A085M9K3_9BILA|nr:hypothetical protein M513_05166 [Trichuris suis]